MRLLFALFVVLASARTSFAADPQSWFFSLIRLTPDPVQFDLLIHERQVNGLNNFGLFIIQPRLSTQCGENLRCALNYSYLVQKLARSELGEVDVLHQNRFEAELNPAFRLTDSSSYNGRNRFEYLTDTSVNHVSSRFRHRSLFEFPAALSESVGLVSGAETFFDFETHRLNQHRIVPVGFRFKLTEKQQFTFMPLAMFNRVDGEWKSSLVFWLELFSDLTATD